MPLYSGKRGIQTPSQLLPLPRLNPAMRGWPELNLADPINSKLVGYWSMDGGTLVGTSLRDLSGSGNTGTLVNTPTLQNGKIGQSLNFVNSSSEYVNVGTMGSFGTQMANFSFATWINTTAANAGYIAGAFNNGGTMGLNIAVSAGNGGTNASGKLNFLFRDNGGTTVEYATTNASNFNDGNWHHLAYVFDNGSSAPRMKIYVDGASQALTVNGTSTGPVSSFANWAFAMTLAARNVRGTIGGFTSCNMDDVRFYARSLTPADVWRLYSDASGGLGLLWQPRRIVGVSAGDTTVTPGAGAVAVTGFAPTLTAGDTLTPGAGAVTATGFAPTVAAGTTLAPGVGFVSVTGFAPTVTVAGNLELTPDAGTVSVTGFAPTITGEASAAPVVGGGGDEDIQRQKWLAWAKRKQARQKRKGAPRKAVPEPLVQEALIEPESEPVAPDLSGALLAANLARVRAAQVEQGARDAAMAATVSALAEAARLAREEEEEDLAVLLMA